MTFQITGRYNSRRVTAQGTLESDWDVEAGVRKNIGSWGISLLCKDIFNSKDTNNVLYGNGYTQSIRKWSGGRTLRLASPIPSANPTVVSIIATTTSTPVATEKSIITKLGKV